MFEKITLKSSENGEALNSADLAEGLFFYQNVHLVLEYGSILQILNEIGCDLFIEVLDRPNVTATYISQSLGTRSISTQTFDKHSFVAVNYAGQNKKKPKNKKDLLLLRLTNHGIDKISARKFCNFFFNKCSSKEYSSDFFIKNGIVNVSNELLYDEVLIKKIARISLEEYSMETPPIDNFIFQILNDKGSFSIISDIDYEKINKHPSNIAAKNKIDNVHIANKVLYSNADLILASHYGSEFKTSNVNSKIILSRYQGIFKKLGKSQSDILSFQEIVNSEGRNIYGAIVSKNKSFKEFLNFLDKSEKFRNWAQSLNPDSNLVQEYIKDISETAFIETIPMKKYRYALSSVAGVINPIAGLVFSAADSFIFSKLLSGWKPNHFINTHYDDFIK